MKCVLSPFWVLFKVLFWLEMSSPNNTHIGSVGSVNDWLNEKTLHLHRKQKKSTLQIIKTTRSINNEEISKVTNTSKNTKCTFFRVSIVFLIRKWFCGEILQMNSKQVDFVLFYPYLLFDNKSKLTNTGLQLLL